MAKEIDARGLSCPQPVMLAKSAIDAGETEIEVVANETVARDNVARLAESAGYTVNVPEDGGEFRLTITKQA